MVFAVRHSYMKHACKLVGARGTESEPLRDIDTLRKRFTRLESYWKTHTARMQGIARVGNRLSVAAAAVTDERKLIVAGTALPSAIDKVDFNIADILNRHGQINRLKWFERLSIRRPFDNDYVPGMLSQFWFNRKRLGDLFGVINRGEIAD